VKEAMFVHNFLTVSPKMKHRIAEATASIARVIFPKVWEERM